MHIRPIKECDHKCFVWPEPIARETVMVCRVGSEPWNRANDLGKNLSQNDAFEQSVKNGHVVEYEKKGT
jgi:hypothetical protein